MDFRPAFGVFDVNVDRLSCTLSGQLCVRPVEKVDWIPLETRVQTRYLETKYVGEYECVRFPTGFMFAIVPTDEIPGHPQ
jgi:hypothetical protein